MNLSQLLIPSPEKTGNIQGSCVWCGLQTHNGLPLRISNNFTGHSYMYQGNCMCPHCWAVFDNASYRRKSWIATSNNFLHIKRQEAIDYLLNPPQPPWYLYISTSGQKQGWLTAIHKVNHGRENFWLSIESQEQPIRTSIRETGSLYEIVKGLMLLKIPKGEMMTGQFSAKSWEKAIKNNTEQLLRSAQKQAKKPIWEVMVYVA